ncbi:MAG: hypothetical protein U0133_17365 [Gemmatimonadales bacterium]
MLRPSLLLLLALVACSDRTGPDSLPCSSTPSVNADFCGTWGAAQQVMGSSLVIDLRIHDQAVVGGGRYVMETGSGGVLTLDGTLRGQYVDLTFTYDYGAKFQYHGQFGVGDRITGALTTSVGNVMPLSFDPLEPR